MSKSREHIVPLCLAPELRMGLIRFQANKELGETYAALLLLTKALYQEQVISREDYERFTQRYSCKLVPPPVPRKLTSAKMAEHQKLEEKRRWFEMAKAEFSAATLASQAAVGGPPGMSVTDPIVYGVLALGIIVSAYEWLRGDKKKAALVASATAIGIILVLPFIPADFAWRFQLMEFLPVSIIIGYAISHINRKDWLIIAVILLLIR